MKQFDVNLAKSGHPVCTRDGRKARIIAFNLKGDYPIVCAVTNPDNEQEGILLYSEDGMSNHVSSDFDLMMASVKHVGWVNVYNVYNDGKDKKTGHNIYATKEEAEEDGGKFRIAIAKIEWEE